jgi:GDP-L-fucose synthase
MDKNAKIYIAGHTGMVGSALLQYLKQLGYSNLLYATRQELDLTNYQQVDKFFSINLPEYVFICSAKVGGIYANSAYPVEFLYDNMMIEFNLIKCAYTYRVKKLLFMLSSCVYPKVCECPITEDKLLSGYLEITNIGYALAKISGHYLCQAYNKEYGTNFISVMPCSIYGIGDNFHPQNSHLIPALIQKIHNAKTTNQSHVEIWGDGTPKREFMHVNDLVDALIFLMNNYNNSDLINVGYGEDLTIAEIASLIKSIIGYKGQFKYNTNMPNGTMRKVLDISKMNYLGWQPKINLKDGITTLYDWWVKKW